MTRKQPRKAGRQRHISVRSVRRTEVDAKRLSRALVNYALLQAAEEAAAEQAAHGHGSADGASTQERT